MAGRALVGVVIGGFWSMSAATVMRLVPEAAGAARAWPAQWRQRTRDDDRCAAGSFLGQFIGWRGAFFAVVPLAAVTLVWLFVSLPSMPATMARERHGLPRPAPPDTFRSAWPPYLCSSSGQFVLQTYLRPFLETVTGVNTSALSLILLVIGGAGVVGTYLIGLLLKTRLYSLLIVIPLLMAVIAVALIAVRRFSLRDNGRFWPPGV